MAVNNEIKMPIPMVTANPRTGPDPQIYKHNAPIRVVMLESRMDFIALEYPAAMA